VTTLPPAQVLRGLMGRAAAGVTHGAVTAQSRLRHRGDVTRCGPAGKGGTGVGEAAQRQKNKVGPIGRLVKREETKMNRRSATACYKWISEKLFYKVLFSSPPKKFSSIPSNL